MAEPETNSKGAAPFAQRYEDRGEIGRGGVGVVSRAYDPRVGREVAVKVPQEPSDEADLVHSFYSEARIAGQLDHPNVVPIYELAEATSSELPYQVMKLVRGESLAQMIATQREKKQGEHHPEEDIRPFVETLIKLCDALSFAHAKGVVHCDLKPDNIMVGRHGEVYLMDWGVALVLTTRAGISASPAAPVSQQRKLDTQPLETPMDPVDVSFQSTTRGFRGTPAFMAPEQLLARVEDIDERTDVFGMGAVLYSILTGDPPNRREELLSRATQSHPVELPDETPVWRRVPPGLAQIAIKALSSEREKRYPSIGELRAALEQFLRGGGWFATRQFTEGELIVRQGELGDTAYIIESGECDVVKEIAGQSRTLRRLVAGEVFGETAVLTSAPRTASVVAVGDVVLKVITADSLNCELDRNPWLASFVRSLASLFRESDAKLAEIDERRPEHPAAASLDRGTDEREIE